MQSIVISSNLTLTCREDQWDAIRTALFSGQRIKAIRMVRAILPHAGLAEAKSYIEKIADDLRREQPGSFAATADNSPMLKGAIVFLIVLAMMGYTIFKFLHK